MYLRDSSRTATSKASYIPRLRRISFRYRSSTFGWSSSKVTYATQCSNGTPSRWTSSAVSRIYSIETCTKENSSLSRESRVMLFRADGRSRTTDAILNVMPLILFWNMIVLLVVVSCEGRDSPWWLYCLDESWWSVQCPHLRRMEVWVMQWWCIVWCILHSHMLRETGRNFDQVW